MEKKKRVNVGPDGMNQFDRRAKQELEDIKKMGAPSKFGTPEEMEAKIDAYFLECDEQNRPYTIAGLGYALGVDRKTVYNYSIKDNFFHIIKRAREKVLVSLEEKMIKEGRPGQIFVGKNYGYADKVEIETTKSNAPDLSGLSIEEIKKMLDK